LFEVWFGSYGAYEAAIELRSRFARVADTCSWGADEAVPDLDGLITPVELTALDVQYDSDDRSTYIVVVDVADPADLMLLWTTRAAGDNVVPWPLTQASRTHHVAELWLHKALNERDARPLGARRRPRPGADHHSDQSARAYS
jgi:hypothetical protein